MISLETCLSACPAYSECRPLLILGSLNHTIFTVHNKRTSFLMIFHHGTGRLRWKHPNHLQKQRIQSAAFALRWQMQTVSGFQWVVKHVTRTARIRTMGTLCARWTWKMNHCRYGSRPYLRPYPLMTSMNSGNPDREVLTNWKLNDSSFFIEHFFTWNVRKFAILTVTQKISQFKAN